MFLAEIIYKDLQQTHLKSEKNKKKKKVLDNSVNSNNLSE